MTKFDLRYSQLHREVYTRMLDDLDSDIVKEIMQNPSCEASLLLNSRVESEIKRRMEGPSKV
jgi:succinate dehydrogenase flavin-adding protein (antitoxin of CptAB toxin-antitoxin module)